MLLFYRSAKNPSLTFAGEVEGRHIEVARKYYESNGYAAVFLRIDEAIAQNLVFSLS